MKKWELARYLIEAKKNIDTLLYIKDNQQLLRNIDLREKIAAACQQFYINCCVVLDNSFPKAKKCLCENEIIASIYYERDKNSAHKDENYRSQKFKTPDELIASLKNQLETARIVCKEYLPENITLDYVPHNKDLFRLVYRVNAQMENDINTVKYPRGVFHSYQLSEEGRHYFRNIDTTEQDRGTAEMFGYDYEEVVKRQVLQSTDDIRELSEEEKARQAVIFENGLNSYEGLQNRQDSCIKVNLLFGLNMWVTPNWKFFEMLDELKAIGFMDQFEIEHLEIIQDEGSRAKLNSIFEKYKLKIQ
ncbi:MAG: hypothetical protein K2G44_02175 [Clostridia bacterium]|nr:hypothetical protein [Clostridia bacterium]